MTFLRLMLCLALLILAIETSQPSQPALAAALEPATLYSAGSSQAPAAQINWTGAAGDGFWDNGANWSTGTVPGGGDDIVVNAVTTTITLRDGRAVHSAQITTTLLIPDSGSLFANGGSQLRGTVTLSGTIGGSVTLAGQTTWGNGSLGQGATNAGTLVLVGSNDKLVRGTLNNSGIISQTSTGNLSIIDNGTFNNLAGGTYGFLSDAGIVSGGGGGAFPILNNAGTLAKAGGTQTSTVGITFNNLSGVIDVQTGTLSLAGGGASNGGTIHVSTGAVLDPTGGSDAGWTGSWSGSGGGAIRLANAILYVGGATFNFPPGLFQWTGGTLRIYQSGSWTNAGTILLTGANDKILAGTLNNSGIISQTGTGNLDIADNVVLNNLAGGTYAFLSDAGVVSAGGGGSFPLLHNAGTLIKASGTGASTLASDVYLDNPGTISVLSGSLFINSGYVAQLSGSTLTAGAWNALAGSSLTFASLGNISTNNAKITLDGSAAAFANLNSLASNNGSLSFLNGKTFSAPGPFANNGDLTLEGTFAVNGDFTAGPNANLNIHLGGAPGSGSNGQVNASGNAALSGTLAISLTNGFAPTQGQVFTVLSYASHTGAFGVINGLKAGGVKFFAASINPTSVQLNALASGADLQAQVGSFPASGSVGQNVTINFTVANLQTQAAQSPTGSWIDSVYLSANGQWDLNSKLIGTVSHGGSLAGGASYNGSLTAPLPGAAAVPYSIVVVADSRRQVPDTNRANNVAVSTSGMAVSLPAISYGVATNGTISPCQDLYFRLPPSPGADVILTATLAAADQVDFYTRLGDVPDDTHADNVYTPASDLRQTAFIPGKGDSVYIWLHGREGAVGGKSFSLLARQAGLGLYVVTPNHGSNLGQASSILTGSGFSASTTVQLVGASTRDAAQVTFVDNNSLNASFDLTGLAAGVYAVRVADSAHSATLGNAYTVNSGAAGSLDLQLTVPRFIRPGRGPGVVTIDYTNNGESDILSPLMLLSAPQAEFPSRPAAPGLVPATAQRLVEFERHVVVRYASPNMAPGAAGSTTRFFQPTTFVPHGLTELTLAAADQPNRQIDWSVIKNDLRPQVEPPDAWDAIFANLTASLGNTLGQYQSLMASNAQYLSQVGRPTSELSMLFNWEMQKADAFGAITRRYALGAFGRGWPDPVDVSAVTDSDGNVTLQTPGSVRPFTRQADGSFAAQPGDAGKLTFNGTNYQLREAGGSLEEFRADGKIAFIQDTNGNRTTFNYTGGNVTSLVLSNGDTTTFTYSGQGRITQISDPEGRITSYSYDGSGEHLLSMTNPRGTTSYSYISGQGAAREHALSSVTFHDGSHLFFQYDARGRLVHRNADGGAQPISISYDAQGRLTQSDGNGVTTNILRNDLLQSFQVVAPLGQGATLGYDPNHNLIQASAFGGQSAGFAYDERNNLIHTSDPLGHTTDAAFDPVLNRMTSLRDARGNSTRYGYDANGNLVSATYADDSIERYGYDARGNMILFTDRGGKSIHFTYNSFNQLVRKDLPEGSSQTYSYDSHRNLTAYSDATGTTNRTYDAGDRLTKVTYPNGRYVQYAYDAGGRLSQIASQDNFTTTYAYDAAGRLSAVTNGNSQPVATYTYDAAGQLARADKGNGTYTTYARDAAGRVVTIVNHAANASPISQIAYSYDAQSHPLTMTTGDGTTTYGYDAAGQLTSVALPGGRTIQYSYDAAGNRIAVVDNATTTNYASNNLNEYVSAGAATYSYDANGNLTGKSDGSGTTTYSYDAEGHLIGTTSPAGSDTFQYDALGHRVAAIHNGVRTDYLLDPMGLANVLGEYDGAGGLIAHFAYGLGLSSRVAPDGSAAFYNQDGNGSTTELTGAGGAVLNRYTYQPYGERLSATETVSNPFTFVGQFGVMDEGGGTYFMRSRWYDAGTGRFVRPDPLRLAGGDVNAYRYAGNNPVSQIDPNGLFDFPIEYWRALQGIIQQSYQASGLSNAEAGFQSGRDINMLQRGTMLRNAASDLGSTAPADAVASTDVAGTVTADVAGTATTDALAAAAPEAAALLPEAAAASIAPVAPTLLATAVAALPYVAVAAGVGIDLYLLYDQQANFALEYYQPVVQPLQNKAYGPRTLEILQSPGTAWCLDAGISFENCLWAYSQAHRLSGSTETILPGDPNDMNGPAGYGPAQFVRAEGGLPYQIEFSNEVTATAAAQVVSVTQQLDAHFDLNSFELTGLGFAGKIVNIPAGRNSFSTRVDARSTLGLFVDITANLDTSSGKASWVFTSIDPETGQAPGDPTAGFLPPNTNPPNGVGWVSYRIKPKAGQPSGTRVSGIGSVIFDTNAPMDTNVVSNTLDSGVPTSTIGTLPLFSNPSFQLAWSGSDEPNGSGLASYDVYASKDGGLFTAIVTQSVSTTVTFTGQLGHHYAFYSLATDNVGHRQPVPSAPQASTTIGYAVYLPVIAKAGSNVSRNGAPASATPDVSATPTGTPAPPNTVTPTGTPSATRVPTNTATPTGTPTATPLPTRTATPTGRPTGTPTATPIDTQRPAGTPSRPTAAPTIWSGPRRARRLPLPK